MPQPEQAPDVRAINRTMLYLFGALGGILFGYDLGIISGVLLFIKKPFHMSSTAVGLLTASVSIGACVGAVGAGRLCNLIGRRHTIQVGALVVIAGTIAAMLSHGDAALTVSRGVIGLGVGLSSATVPTYLSELAPARLRGALGSLNQIFIVSGILIASIVAYELGHAKDWRGMFAGALVPAVILVVGLAFLPETPRWLVNKGRDAEARRVLIATHPGEDADAELDSIREVIRMDSENRGRFRDLFAPWVRPILLVAVILAIGQQFSGVNAINAYFPTMLVSLGFSTSTSLLSAIVLGLSKLVFTAWVVFVVDRWGRKPLLLIGNVIMVVTLTLAGIVILNVSGKTALGTETLILLVLYLVGYELGWGAVVWVMMSEVFPLRLRAAGMGVATVCLWAATGLVTYEFPIISDKAHLGLGHTMWVFAGINMVLFFLVRWLVPETKGRSLEQIELDLRGASQRVAAPKEVVNLPITSGYRPAGSPARTGSKTIPGRITLQLFWHRAAGSRPISPGPSHV
jgi:sugar porter (SP) family MFS transporter